MHNVVNQRCERYRHSAIQDVISFDATNGTFDKIPDAGNAARLVYACQGKLAARCWQCRGGGGGYVQSNPGSREIVLNIKSSVCHDVVSFAEKINQTTVLCDNLDRRTPCPQVGHVGHTTCRANTYQTFEGVMVFVVWKCCAICF